VKRSLRTIGLGGVAAALLFAGVACSSSEETSSSTTKAPQSTTTTAAEAGTILEVATEAGTFTTLADLITEADLVATLSGEGPFTVFAPTDAAFEKVPAELLETVGADPELLATVLTYHVVSGKVLSSDLTDGQVINTVQGGTLTVGISGNTVTLTDAVGRTSTVTAADLEASNGVIHVIDTVLLPVDPATL
jgi:uncharacterized surface protein with fasciclin (FAS1) repeats